MCFLFKSEDGAKLTKILPKYLMISKKMKKACCHRPFSSLMHTRFKLVFNDGIVRACASAGTATNARISVDDVDATFGNSANRAFVDAGAASDTFVSDFVSHNV